MGVHGSMYLQINMRIKHILNRALSGVVSLAMGVSAILPASIASCVTANAASSLKELGSSSSTLETDKVSYTYFFQDCSGTPVVSSNLKTDGTGVDEARKDEESNKGGKNASGTIYGAVVETENKDDEYWVKYKGVCGGKYDLKITASHFRGALSDLAFDKPYIAFFKNSPSAIRVCGYKYFNVTYELFKHSNDNEEVAIGANVDTLFNFVDIDQQQGVQLLSNINQVNKFYKGSNLSYGTDALIEKHNLADLIEDSLKDNEGNVIFDTSGNNMSNDDTTSAEARKYQVQMDYTFTPSKNWIKVRYFAGISGGTNQKNGAYFEIGGKEATIQPGSGDVTKRN